MVGPRRDFIEEQIRALTPLDFVAFLVPVPPGVGVIEVARDEEGDGYRASIGAEPALTEPVTAALTALGFVPGEPRQSLASTDIVALADKVDSALEGPLGAPAGARVDVHNGSRRDEVERERRLKALKERLSALLTKLLSPKVFEVDPDGDFTFPFQSTRVWVAPRVLPGGPMVVRVFAVTNVEIDPTPALGIFLSETNFALAFGRFALDAQRRAVWFEETLLGEFMADEELTFVVQIVASTADQFDDRIAATFGGRVFNAPGQAGAAAEVPAEKPGAAGYL